MNNFMADLFDTLNAVFGFLGFLGSFVVAYLTYINPEYGGFGFALLGFISSIMFTILFFGFTAVIIDIRHKLYRVGIQK